MGLMGEFDDQRGSILSTEVGRPFGVEVTLLFKPVVKLLLLDKLK